ncbi:MAG TPA: hypothetical protein VG476_05260 [Acidimicrobiales bacterium]|nr:hypothetical protein [Acidimicrobiales bacterium]
MNDSEESEDAAVFTAPALLPIIWADPEHLPEHLALFAVKHFGHRAGSRVERLRGSQPDASSDELVEASIARGVRVTVTEGAVMGGPIVLLVPVAFVVAALAQSQMVFEIAALEGRNPTDQLRAADLLAIQAAYPSAEDASEGLAQVKTDRHDRDGKRLPRGTRMAMIRRMAFLLGLIEPPTGPKPSRIRRVLTWAGIALFVAVGVVLPLIWIPAMAVMFQKSTRRLGARARRFYSQADGADTGVEVRVGEPGRVRPVRLVFFVRTLLVALLPVLAFVAFVLASLRFIGNRWSSAGLVLVAVSLVSTLAWLGYRRWRLRRRRVSALG